LEKATLAQELQPSAIDFDDLHGKYRPMLRLVRELIGVIPNCDPLLEIWSTGFRTYNLLVPNCLNLPFSLFGFGGSKALMGLAMYAASRAASCAYCSAHTFSFALRRGASTASLLGHRTDREAAVVTVAEGLSQIPCDLTAAACEELNRYCSPSEIEWIVLSVGLMGFLNKFMDAVGVELEAKALEEVSSFLAPTGWTPGQHAEAGIDLSNASEPPSPDDIWTYFRVLRQVPSAIRLEQRWTAGVPNQWPEVGDFLEMQTGNRFPVLSKLRHSRMIRALTTVLRDNLDTKQSEVGLRAKCLAGFVYAIVVKDETLASEARLLATRLAPELDESVFNAVEQLASKPVGNTLVAIEQLFADLSALPKLSDQDVASIIMARAASLSPADINPFILPQATSHLTSASVVELVVWLSVQQLLHRIGCFYAVAQH
jgi:hypothetical protein